MPVSYSQASDWIRAFAATVAENKVYLTELDSAIGDADHGINMNRGMQAVVAKIDGISGPDIGALLKTVGMTLVSTVGGAGGPLYGTLFLQMGTSAAGKPTFELGPSEMEIGIGIHGEPGRRRMEVASAHDVVGLLATPIVEDLPFSAGDKVLAFVNSMGGTPLIELYVVYNELNHFLADRGIEISRNLIGPFITSLEMQGCSITLLKLDDELTALWDAPVNTPGLRWGA